MLGIVIIVFVCGVVLMWLGHKLSLICELQNNAPVSWPFWVKFAGSMVMVIAVLLGCLLISSQGGGG